MSDHDRGRELRRRHMHERQAVVFGVLIASLAVAGLGAAALYTDSLSLPFLERGFSSSPEPEAESIRTYCPPEGAMPVPLNEVAVDVYNGAGVAGLAAQTAAALTERGFTIAATDNASSLPGAARIIYGVNGSAQAYTLHAYVPDAVLQLDARTDGLVDLVIGSEYEGLAPPEQVALDPAAPLVGPDGCTPFSEMTAPAPDAPAAEGEAPADGEAPAEGEGAEG